MNLSHLASDPRAHDEKNEHPGAHRVMTSMYLALLRVPFLFPLPFFPPENARPTLRKPPMIRSTSFALMALIAFLFVGAAPAAPTSAADDRTAFLMGDAKEKHDFRTPGGRDLTGTRQDFTIDLKFQPLKRGLLSANVTVADQGGNRTSTRIQVGVKR